MIKRYLVPGAPPPPHGVVYHHATEAAGWLHVTGQLPADPNAPQAPFAPGSEAQAAQAFANVVAIVEAADYALKDAIFVRVYLTDFDRDYDGFNRVYLRFFPDAEAAPSRTTGGVARLGRGALVEIDLVLYRAP